MPPRKIIKRLVSGSRRQPTEDRDQPEVKRPSDEEQLEAIRQKLQGYRPSAKDSLFIDDFGTAPVRKPIRDSKELRRR